MAVFLLGGETAPVDTEDVAVRANELAPGRFLWKKYEDQINLEVVRVYLSDAKKPEKGSYLRGSGTEGWMLTEKGLAYCRRAIKTMPESQPARKAFTPQQKQWMRSERIRLLSEPAFVSYASGGITAVKHRDALAFFRIDEYVPDDMRERKILRVVNAFGDDASLGDAVRGLATKAREHGHE